MESEEDKDRPPTVAQENPASSTIDNEDIKRAKHKRRSKDYTAPRERKNKKLGNDELDVYLSSIVEKMRKANLEDRNSNKEQRPATEKLSLVEDLYRKLINRDYQKELLEKDVLSVIRTWLEPLPDRSLPNIEIRRGMLEALMHMKVDVAHLRQSGVGKIVNFYSFNPKEEKAVRKLAKNLVQKWTKLVLSSE